MDDQKVLAGQQLLQALKTPIIGSFDQFVNQGGSGCEADLETLLAGGQSQPQGNMGFTSATWPECEHVLPTVDEGATGELHGQDPVQ